MQTSLFPEIIDPVIKNEILAVCDGCGRNIMENEVAWLRYGIHCFDCCKIIWEHGIEYLEQMKIIK